MERKTRSYKSYYQTKDQYTKSQVATETQEGDIAILPKFKERYIKSYHKVALKRYYKKDKPIILTKIY